MKKCSRCKIEKPVNCFSRNVTRKDGKQHTCKECFRKRSQTEHGKLLSKKSHLRNRYGIRLEEIPEQCQTCKIVGKVVVDHCHSTGKTRGFLCYRCNTALGLVKEKTETLKALIAYINEYDSNKM